MRNAPSVLYPVGRCAFYARLLVVLGVLGLAAWVLTGWYACGAGSCTAHAGAVWWGGGPWLLWMGFAAWSWRRSPTGALQWDALAAGTQPDTGPGAWRWRSDTCQEGAVLRRVEQMLDVQGHVLLRLHHLDAVTRWVWLERRLDPARWDDLRRALVANA